MELESLKNNNVREDKLNKISNNTRNQVKNVSNVNKHVKSFGLNLSNLPRQDFNEEFMANYDEFSPSWRKEADKINLSKKVFYLDK